MKAKPLPLIDTSKPNWYRWRNYFLEKNLLDQCYLQRRFQLMPLPILILCYHFCSEFHSIIVSWILHSSYVVMVWDFLNTSMLIGVGICFLSLRLETGSVGLKVSIGLFQVLGQVQMTQQIVTVIVIDTCFDSHLYFFLLQKL